MSRLLFLVPALALPAASAVDLKPAAPKVTAYSFSVTKPAPDDDVFSRLDAGTFVGVLVEVPGKFVIGLDPRKCTLDAFTDDKGTNLRVPVDRNLSTFTRVTDDAFGSPDNGKYVKAVFRAPRCPAAGATKVRVKGKVAVLVGRAERQVEKKNVSLKAGAEFEFGLFKLQDPVAGMPAIPPSVDYRGTKAVKLAVFLDPAGAEVAMRRSSTGGLRNAGRLKAEYSAIFHPARFGKTPDRCTLRVTYFDEVEPVTVPIDLEVGPGL
jgi:hypothetical protein